MNAKICPTCGSSIGDADHVSVPFKEVRKWRLVSLDRGWLKKQFEEVEKEVASWPEWMRRETGLAGSEVPDEQASS